MVLRMANSVGLRGENFMKIHEGNLIDRFRRDISTKKGVRAYKVKLYDIFSVKNKIFDDIHFANNITLPQNRACYDFETNGKIVLNDEGEFRLIKVGNDFATFLYVGNTRDVEQENQIIKDYLENKILIPVW